MIVNVLLLDYGDRMKLPCCPTRVGKIVGSGKLPRGLVPRKGVSLVGHCSVESAHAEIALKPQ
jgi:hypothetical protein